MNPFGAELRRLRNQRGYVLRELAKIVHRSKSDISEWELGTKVPPPDAVLQLDDALAAGGRLAALAVHLPSANGNTERLARVAEKPRTVDLAAIRALDGMLANMRRLEDSVGAGPLIEP